MDRRGVEPLCWILIKKSDYILSTTLFGVGEPIFIYLTTLFEEVKCGEADYRRQPNYGRQTVALLVPTGYPPMLGSDC